MIPTPPGLTPEDAKLLAIEQREAVKDSLHQTIVAFERKIHTLDVIEERVAHHRWSLIAAGFAIAFLIGLRPKLKLRHPLPEPEVPPFGQLLLLLALKALPRLLLR
jgi:hypothetical protein